MRVMDIPTIWTMMNITTVHRVWDLSTQGKNDAVLSDEFFSQVAGRGYTSNINSYLRGMAHGKLTFLISV